MSKAFYAGLVLAVGLTAASWVNTALHAQSGGPATRTADAIDKKALDLEYERDAAIANQVGEEPLTKVEQLYARHYQYFKLIGRGVPIREKLGYVSGREELKTLHMTDSIFAADDVLAGIDRLCATSDAVVVGSVVARTAQFAEGDSFLITNHSVRIDSVLKSPTQLEVGSGDLIVVLRPGGVAFVDGVLVKTIVESVGLLSNGELVLFLKYDPESKSFRTSGHDDSLEPLSAYDITAGTVESQSGARIDLSHFEDSHSFLKYVSRNCQGHPSGERDRSLTRME